MTSAISHGAFSEGVHRAVENGRAVVLKTVASGGDPASFRYAGREVTLLRGELLEPYRRAGLAPPQLLDVRTHGTGRTMVLADAGDRMPATVPELVDAAGRLGRAQGRYVGAVPAEPWLCSNFVADYAVGAQDAIEIEAVLDDERLWLQAGPFAELRAASIELWGRRSELAELVSTAPSALLHNDFWPPNLVCGGTAGYTLLDWAFCGPGPLGSDPANLVVDAVFDGYLSASALPQLAEQVWPAYLAGLREVVDVDPAAVRLGFVSSGALKYCWLAPRTVRRWQDGTLRSYAGALEAAATLEARAAGMRVVLDWAGEAFS